VAGRARSGVWSVDRRPVGTRSPPSGPPLQAPAARLGRLRSPCDAAAAVGSAVGHVPDIEDGTACGASRVGEMGRRMGSCVGEGHMAAGPACRDPFSNGVVGVMSL